MALAKDRMINSNIIQDIVGLEKTGTPKNSSLLSAMSLQSNGVVFRAEEAHGSTVINFKTTTGYSTLLSFEQSQQRANSKITNSTSHKDEYSNWDDNLNHNVYHEYPRMSADFINCFQTASSDSCSKLGNRDGDESSYGWLYSESTVCADSFEESATPAEPGFHKRHQMGESTQPVKKQCTNSSSNSASHKKPKSTSLSKDPQSIAAKNRRERISERLKILQELVPNGSKVDLVTMLEKAISYVKFLQLQVKVLATDEFWPVQGGKLLIFLK
ncbi:hypothetical protein FNV43_RR14042 [Rhamnella rubrinervis]|uniref:BHLH domain-containing protein n=1 Tax=Rhamnella rubrinervis TaxID=2594499 RepID=A0A8K0MFU8_9ROSA|nr:hypothetical protein FNV43_RR14042 [Rhamnella rubrinervis]